MWTLKLKPKYIKKNKNNHKYANILEIWSPWDYILIERVIGSGVFTSGAVMSVLSSFSDQSNEDHEVFVGVYNLFAILRRFNNYFSRHGSSNIVGWYFGKSSASW